MNQVDKFTKKIIFILLTSFISHECTSKNQETNIIDSMANQTEHNIEYILEKQLEKGVSQYIYGTESQVMDYSEEDMNACVQLSREILISNGYKEPSKDVFKNKIKSIFNRELDFNSNKKYLYINSHDICDRKVLYIPNNIIDYQGTYIIKNKLFITDFYRIPELVDYQKKYPYIINFEKNIPINRNTSEYGEVTISLWKDEDLDQLRYENQQKLIHRNKYLFNDDRASFVWLYHNDQFFLRTLLTVFGYAKEEKINKLVLDELYKKYKEQGYTEEMAALFFTKDCNGKLSINKELLNYVEKTLNENNDQYIMALSHYIIKLYSDHPSVFTATEKAEIVAYISDIEIRAREKYQGHSTNNSWNIPASGLYYLQYQGAMNHPEVLDIMKKHNYFGFTFLKQYIESGQLKIELLEPYNGDEVTTKITSPSQFFIEEQELKPSKSFIDKLLG